MVVDAPKAADARATRGASLTAEEAAFVQAAFERILPEAPRVPAWIYIDRKLAAHGDGEGTAVELDLYRQGIAWVQARCRLVHGRAFQALAMWHQLAILAELEDQGRAGSEGLRSFMFMLLNDVAEAYFDAMQRRTNSRCAGMAVHEAAVGEPCPEPLVS